RPMPGLRERPAGGPPGGPGRVGGSCNSWDAVQEAARLGADCCTFSHVYPTQCKPGLPPRGLEALRQVCAQSPVPIYALGGVTPEKIPELEKAGAAGAVMMGWWKTVDC
ncbi:thiamine phosphate synthase, partial [Acidaminococcus fermentans]|uniref:thiamine phosphate synthase n=1 Tax=Acidaminococcus fermentans TaxID=905 RepID=UPI00266CF717